ncbi:hypothetical protein [Piscinibacter sp. HJYY11]|uniref:hypothetical protein n=1 Tax=Piscinibacter sp. HJYY11 TaxID=2801333 RepID=UPI00191E5CE1|nr:hypothetical protein [Piscinibacter sp. HJYY11]MBL0726472.1 hypothetical protein [Piscinibacter sp. HJYY11]
MLRKIILLAITTGIGKRLWDGFKAYQAKAAPRPVPVANTAAKPATATVSTGDDH